MTVVEDAEFQKEMSEFVDALDEKGAHRLKDLVIKRVGGVSDPAHGHSGWAVLKSADSPPAASTMPATRAGATDRLDDLAKARSRSTGQPYAKAYGDVLATPEGEALYSAHDAAPPESSGPAVERRTVEKSAVQLEQEDLEHYSKAAFPGLPPLQASVAWLATPAGAEWYNRKHTMS